MEFLIAETFTDALARLPAQEQKAAKTSAFDIQLDPASPGLQLHRIDRSKDPNFWSARVNRDLRIIVHKTAASMLLAYVDHHDRAYAWAERRRIETHPKTGAVQIVEVRERVDESAPALFDLASEDAPASDLAPGLAPPIFTRLSADDLLSVGVPQDWVEPLLGATEARFYELSEHLPREAAESLLEFAATGHLKRPEPSASPADPFSHPDSRRRFQVIENQAELEAALNAPWDKWAIFLHPSQRELVERAYSGPARVAGSAGTGKTVVALHRSARLARNDPSGRVLLTTFSQPLADALKRKLALLVAEEAISGRITVTPWQGVADELHQLAFGRRPRIASDEQVRAALRTAAEQEGLTDQSERFLISEFTQVVDAWQVDSLERYATTPRLGRKSRLGPRQRERLWPVFASGRKLMHERGLSTWPGAMGALTEHYLQSDRKPFTSIVVDEAQDLGVPELRLLRALAPGMGDALFFAGDLGQRIFQTPFSWKALGVDVRGRSSTLKVNYRTSHQIREAADRLLPPVVRDLDGREEERRGTVSVFEGPAPEVLKLDSPYEEAATVAGFLRAAINDGIEPKQIGVFVRSRVELERARTAVREAGLSNTEHPDRSTEEAVLTGTMHLAKGLEFRAVVVMACDADVLPSAERLASVADEADLDEVYDTERHLLYVACTRARDRLLVCGLKPASEYLDDLTHYPAKLRS